MLAATTHTVTLKANGLGNYPNDIIDVIAVEDGKSLWEALGQDLYNEKMYPACQVGNKIYSCDGFYLNPQCEGEEIYYRAPINEDTILYAKWELIEIILENAQIDVSNPVGWQGMTYNKLIEYINVNYHLDEDFEYIIDIADTTDINNLIELNGNDIISPSKKYILYLCVKYYPNNKYYGYTFADNFSFLFNGESITKTDYENFRFSNTEAVFIKQYARIMIYAPLSMLPTCSAPTYANIGTNVNLEGVGAEAGKFSFTLEAVTPKAPMPTNTTVSNNANGAISFGDIKFKTAGTYTYTIKQNAGNVETIAYDDKTITATVTVTDNGNGSLVSNVSYSDTTPFVNTLYDIYSLWIDNGKQVHEANKDNLMGGTASYNPTTKTLTLNGYNGGAISADGELNIVVTGDNVITVGSAADEISGISVKRACTITGDGNLTINLNSSSYTVKAINISEEKEMQVDGYTYMEAVADDLTINMSGDLNINSNSVGIYADNITVSSSGNLTIDGGGICGTGQIVVNGSGDITVIDGSIYADGNIFLGGSGSYSGRGIWAYENADITIGDSRSVTITEENNSAVGAALCTSEGDVIISTSGDILIDISGIAIDSGKDIYLNGTGNITINSVRGLMVYGEGSAVYFNGSNNIISINITYEYYTAIESNNNTSTEIVKGTTLDKYVVEGDYNSTRVVYTHIRLTHKWATEWTANKTHHWHECVYSECNITDDAEKGGYEPHTYDDGAFVCNVCSNARPSETAFASNGNVNIVNAEYNDAILVLSGYNEDGRLVDVKLNDINSRAITQKALSEFGLNLTGIVKIKAMLWESVTSLKPFCYAAEKVICETHSGGTATCTDRAVCEVCGLSYGDLLLHNYSADWTIDDTNHWHECGRCHDKKDIENHIFDYVCDTDCNVCGYTREATHVLDETGTCECGEVYTSQGLGYTLLENGTYELSGIGTCTDTAVFVPSTYEGKAVTSVKETAFFMNKNITSVYLPDSITSIGENAFAYCYYIKKINIPTNLAVINEGAFQYCYAIKNITIPSGVTTIGTQAFRDCRTVESIVIPSNVTSIGKNAFNRCTSLRELVILEGATKIDESIVRECTSLRSITIPKSVTEFARYSFDINHITIKYNGTKAEWETITKDRYWNVIRNGSITCCHNIVCTDQAITNFNLTWTSDETGHTYTCNQCNTTSEKQSHYYSDDHDVSCNDCGYLRTVDENNAESPI